MNKNVFQLKPFLLLLLLLLPLQGFAQSGPTPPDQLLRQGIDRLTGFLAGAPDASTRRVGEFVTEEIAVFFDFATMARWTAGPAWNRLHPARRAALVQRVRETFLQSFTRNIGALGGVMPTFRILRPRPGRAPGMARVRALAYLSARPPMRFEFKFRLTHHGWAIYDVSLNGLSAVAYYRRYFRSLLSGR